MRFKLLVDRPCPVMLIPMISMNQIIKAIHTLGIPVLVLGLSAGCGGGNETASQSSSTQGSGGAGSGGNMNTGGGNGEGGAQPFVLCSPKAVGLEGTLEGTAIASSSPILKTRVKGPLWQGFFRPEGHVALFGEGNLEMPGTSSAATGLFRMPIDGEHAGEWYCAGQGSNITVDTTKTFELNSISKLGSCADAVPVDGTVEGCFGADISLCPLGMKLNSTLVGAEFDWKANVLGYGGMPGLYEIFLDNGGILALYIELDTVLGGLLLIAPGGPDAGGAYCIGPGSLQPGGSNAMKFSLTGLKRLGSCTDAKAVAGSLKGCIE